MAEVRFCGARWLVCAECILLGLYSIPRTLGNGLSLWDSIVAAKVVVVVVVKVICMGYGVYRR